MPLADQSYHGHAHIQRVASCAAAGIWKSVKRNINTLITLSIITREVFKVDALNVNTCRRHALFGKLKPAIFVENRTFEIEP